MWKEIESIVNGMKNKYLQRLVAAIYKSNKKKLMVHPASVKMHHNFRSGFLEHILTMAQISKKVSPLYDVDRDLALAGVFLHDIGKLKEINSEYEADYTNDGNLIGHIVIGRDMVRDAIKKIRDFPEDLGQKMAMHIAATNPISIDKGGIEKSIIDKELEIIFLTSRPLIT